MIKPIKIEKPHFYIPRANEHTTIVGRNGSGKTQMGAYLLSRFDDYSKMPTIILDYKGDELLNSISRARVIDDWKVPKKPGLYILHSNPDFSVATEKFMRDIWSAGNTRLYVDEAYMLPSDAGQGKAMRSLLTQGRSLRIPVVTLSQRPVEIDRYHFSEASHVCFFALNDDRDKDTVKRFTPKGFIEHVPGELTGHMGRDKTRLPPFHSRWYNIKHDWEFFLRPVPDADIIRDEIEKKLLPKKRWL